MTIYECVENLILNQNVSKFLFGSKSQFNDLCHSVVTRLKQKYPFIKRIHYAINSETTIFENNKELIESCLLKITNIKNNLLAFEQRVEYKNILVSGKASYVERNYAMIDNSDYCIFYYDKNNSKNKSGTEIAYSYAKRKNKKIINLYV